MIRIRVISPTEDRIVELPDEHAERERYGIPLGMLAGGDLVNTGVVYIGGARKPGHAVVPFITKAKE